MQDSAVSVYATLCCISICNTLLFCEQHTAASVSPLPLLLHTKERQTITLASVFVEKKRRNLIIKGGLEARK